MRIKSTLLLLAVFLAVWNVPVQAQGTNDIDGLVTGQLDNGLRYYIMESHLQDNKASFYLVQKAGAILEEDNENGLAHFLEHMAFNGSKHFPDGVNKFLKSQGVTKFNAFTAYDQTVYNIDDVDATNPMLVDTCIYLLRDWCGDLLLTKDEINKERGVIEEEWRSRRNVDKRRQLAVAPYIFYNTKYVERDVIGDMDIVRNFKPKTLRGFYEKWYRADMQGVIIVGDINPEEIEQRVKELFSDLKVSPKAPAIPEPIKMVPNEDPMYVAFKDDEVQRTTIQLISRYEQDASAEDYEDVRREIQMREYFNAMAYRRFVDFVNAEQEQFFTADVGVSKLLGNFYAKMISVTPFPGKDKEALEQVLTVLAQIKEFGFTEEEVERQKEIMYQRLEAASRNIDKYNNSIYVNKLRANFFSDVPVSDIQEGIDNLMETILEIEVEDVNEWAKGLDINENLLIEVDANTNATDIPTKEEVLSVMDKVANKDLTVKKEIEKIDQLVDFDIDGGTIESVDSLPQYGAEVWTLSNGVRVVYKYTNEGTKGDFQLYSQSYGGKSVLASDELPSASALVSLATKSGIYRYDRNTMMNYIRDKHISINLTLNELSESLRGGAEAEDADVLFQFVYLFLTHPRFDKEDFESYKRKLAYKESLNVPTAMTAVSDSVRMLTTKPNDRSWKLGEEYFDEMDFDEMKSIFNKAFGDADDFTYYIVGDIEKDRAKELAAKYIAALPSDENAEANTFKTYDFSVDDPVIKKQYEVTMPESKGLIDISYVNSLELTEQEKIEMNVLVYTLRNRYFQSVREDYSGTYGVKVNPIVSEFPVSKQQLSISFQTDPDRVDELMPLVYDELDDIKTNGVYSFELEEAVSQMKRAQEMSRRVKGIAYWTNVLAAYEERGIDTSTSAKFDAAVDKITPETIKEFTNKFFDSAKLREIVIIQRAPETDSVHKHVY